MLSKRLGQLISGSNKMIRLFGAGVDLEQGKLIGGHKHLGSIRTGVSYPGLLKKASKVLNDQKIALYTLNGQPLEIADMYYQTQDLEVSFDGTDPETIKKIKEQLSALDIDFIPETPPLVPWFPMNEADMDLIGTSLLQADDGLNQDHPGFVDKAYKARRNTIANNTLGYKMADPIPNVEYVPEEVALWGRIYREVRPLHKEFGCREFNCGADLLEKEGYISPTRISQLEDLNQYLKGTNNWRIKPANGFLSQREALNSFGMRTFCSTQYIRHPSKPDYTPEPDIMHEFLGHMPLFTNPNVCEMTHLIGMLSLGASDAQIDQLASIYWFTMEFGICRQENDIKFYGAGPGGSFGEILSMKHMANNHMDKIYRLDILKSPPPIKFVIQDVQPFFYASDSFDDCLEQLKAYSNTVKKPFNLIYNEKTNRYDVDRAIVMKNFEPGV